MRKHDNFDTNVFVNCPLDDEYRPLLRAIVFTVLACGFIPRSALEERDAGVIRLEKIKRLITESRLSIHDISRTSPDGESRLPRFNMPFELGLDMGARHWGRAELRQKVVIIFDTERFRYQKFLSDIAGQDISSHRGKPHVLIAELRHWLNSLRGSPPALPSAGHLIQLYQQFSQALPEVCQSAVIDISHLGYDDFRTIALRWLGTQA